MSLKDTLKSNLYNLRGWHTGRRFIVIESDDWGSVRMPSKNAYEGLLKKGLRVDLCPYNKFDNLESKEDLEALYSTLSKFKDNKGNPPVITANTVMANPDFEKIRNSGFEHYYYEPFTTTLQTYYPDSNVLNIWKQGVEQKYLWPQLHGREHLNPAMWLDELCDNEDVRKAFDYNIFGLSRITSPKIKKPYLAALIYKDEKGKKAVEASIEESADLFEKIFGFASESFIAPLYTWHNNLEPIMLKKGIKYIQGANSHKVYDYATNSRKSIFHAFGSKNNQGQLYLNRNCIFEPSLNSGGNDVDRCIKQIASAFFWNKPAVICSHRLNFIGSLVEENRTKNLKALEILLEKILSKWPDVEFISSAQLGDYIANSKR